MLVYWNPILTLLPSPILSIDFNLTSSIPKIEHQIVCFGSISLWSTFTNQRNLNRMSSLESPVGTVPEAQQCESCEICQHFASLIFDWSWAHTIAVYTAISCFYLLAFILAEILYIFLGPYVRRVVNYLYGKVLTPPAHAQNPQKTFGLGNQSHYHPCSVCIKAKIWVTGYQPTARTPRQGSTLALSPHPLIALISSALSKQMGRTNSQVKSDQRTMSMPHFTSIRMTLSVVGHATRSPWKPLFTSRTKNRVVKSASSSEWLWFLTRNCWVAEFRCVLRGLWCDSGGLSRSGISTFLLLASAHFSISILRTFKPPCLSRVCLDCCFFSLLSFQEDCTLLLRELTIHPLLSWLSSLWSVFCKAVCHRLVEMPR